jgi:hypothetical protein
MRFTWSQHLTAARTLAGATHEHQGTAMALMGVALLLLLQDLADAPQDLPASTGA